MKSVLTLLQASEFVWFIEQGYLSPIIPQETDEAIDVDNVSIARGDYNITSLTESMDKQKVIEKALDESIAKAIERKHWLIFASSIDHCEQIAAYLNSKEIKATAVHSKLDDKERNARLQGFQDGTYRAVVNQNILTTGFDYPEIDLIIMLRPTRSPCLWVQMLGRGTRPVFPKGFDLSTQSGRLAAIKAGPKQNCVVHDYSRNTERLGPINYPQMPNKKGSKVGNIPVRLCPQCSSYVHISLSQCNFCGYEFPAPENITITASSEELIRDSKKKKVKTEIFPVSQMNFTRHKKIGKPDSVRVDYYCGFKRFSVWVGFEHQGYMQRAARMWWYKNAKNPVDAPPKKTNDLLENFRKWIKQPTHIKVKLSKPYARILDYDFKGTGFGEGIGGSHALSSGVNKRSITA